jgi:hypothetical protein
MLVILQLLSYRLIRVRLAKAELEGCITNPPPSAHEVACRAAKSIFVISMPKREQRISSLSGEMRSSKYVSGFSFLFLFYARNEHGGT